MRRWIGGLAAALAASTALATLGALAGAGANPCPTPTTSGAVPGTLVPLFLAAAAHFHLGTGGAAVLASINQVESNFDAPGAGVQSGANSAGAAGPMQIGIEGRAGDTWDHIKVNAPTDPPGQPPDVYDEADAVYSAAHYLALSGMNQDPTTWPNALYAYNHAQWYVTRVLHQALGYLHTTFARGAVTITSSAVCGEATLGYVNPFADIPAGHLIPERIDMGVDYADNHPDPILALGNATVSYAGPDPGWENGNSINYTLTSGPYTGRSIYLAESITPLVHPGQHLTAGQPVARFAQPNIHGIETGFATGPGRPEPEAAALHQQAPSGDPGNNRTYCGTLFNNLLASLGAPSGLPGGRAVTGNQC